MPTILIEYEGGEGHEENVSQEQASFIETYLRVNMELPANDDRGAKSLAQQIREQLEREGMTVKQILERNISGSMCNYNILTPIEARRREVERAAEIVREREPSLRSEGMEVYAHYTSDGEFRSPESYFATVGEIRMQSTAQWHLLRDVIGDEGLKELIQK